MEQRGRKRKSKRQSISSRQAQADYYRSLHRNYEYASFLQPGVHTFRVYPYRNSEGQARVFRRVRMDGALPINSRGKTIRVWASDEIDEIIQQAKLAGLTKIGHR